MILLPLAKPIAAISIFYQTLHQSSFLKILTSGFPLLIKL